MPLGEGSLGRPLSTVAAMPSVLSRGDRRLRPRSQVHVLTLVLEERGHASRQAPFTPTVASGTFHPAGDSQVVAHWATLATPRLN